MTPGQQMVYGYVKKKRKIISFVKGTEFHNLV